MVASTHRVHFVDGVVEKHYRSWQRGEPAREWSSLMLLARHCPDLAPRPLSRRWVDGVPVVVMSRVPGVPLGDSPLDSRQLAGVADALHLLYDVAAAALDGVPVR